MISRCTKPHDASYHHYRRDNIKVCKRWLQFENFLADMGPRPANTTLDRIDNKKGYNKRNCRWACPSTQSNNRRNVIKYLGRTLRDWSNFTGLNYETLKTRFYKTGNLGV